MFGIQLAKEKRVKFQRDYYERHKNKKNRQEILLYFAKDEQQIRFTLFDYYLQSIDFGTK